MRNLDKLIDTFTVAGLAPGSITFKGIIPQGSDTLSHTGILRGKEVQYSTDPADDPTGEVTRILFPEEEDTWEL